MLTLSSKGLSTVLFLGAHSDDIEIGCGGTILSILEANPAVSVTWVVLSSDPRREAEAHGARLHHHTRVRELICAHEWSDAGPSRDARLGVLLDDGTVVAADRTIVAAGAWAASLLGPTLGATHGPPALRVLRRVLAWTRADEPARARLRRAPWRCG